MKGSGVLVTGAQGFIGPALCRCLAAAGAEVHAVGRRQGGSEEGGVRRWLADLTDREATERLVRQVRPDYVFHMAGLASGRREPSLVCPTFDSNLATTVNVLAAVTEVGGARVVLPGSLEEPEGDWEAAVPASPYAASKWAASAYGRMFHSLYGTPVAVARLFMVYGPSLQDLRKLVPHVILSLLHGEEPELGAGTRPIDWIYLDDAVDGLIALARCPSAEGRHIDIGSGVATTVRSVAEILTELMGTGAAPRFGALPERPMEQVRVADVEGTRAVLGWEPRVPLREGLARTVAWYRGQVEGGRIPWSSRMSRVGAGGR